MRDASSATADFNEVDTAILSVGSTEGCGPKLPLNLDTLLARYYARAFGEALGAYVLPTLPFNTAEEHAAFKGTVSLRPATMMLVMEEVIAGLHAQGFTKFVLTSGHGGAYWTGAFIKDINHRYPRLVLVNGHHGGDARWREGLHKAGLGGRNDVHGGALSRALALYLAPGNVKAGAFGAKVGDEGTLMDYVGWEKLTPDGSWGRYDEKDEAVATAEAGRTLLEHFTRAQSEYLKRHLSEAARLKGVG